MKKTSVLLAISLLCVTVRATAQGHEADRLKHAGEVLQEILNIPDNLPKSILDKSECVIVIPSAKKFAIGIGGNYGRGAMTPPSGEHFTGPWAPPAMVALAVANIRSPPASQPTDFLLLPAHP